MRKTLCRRQRWSGFRCALVLLGLSASACMVQRVPAPPTPAAVEPAASIHSPAPPESGVAVVIQKTERTLTLYRDGIAVQQFPVVMGRNQNGPKRFEGDMRTPEGIYRVTDKHPHARWRYFIGISYPNEYDVAAYARAITEGGVPVVNGEFMGIGGSVGIHGSDHHQEQAAGFDWTMGCVALRSEDIGVIYENVEPGTPVLILP
jgi:murein L,D-transpeptidase YafK